MAAAVHAENATGRSGTLVGLALVPAREGCIQSIARVHDGRVHDSRSGLWRPFFLLK